MSMEKKGYEENNITKDGNYTTDTDMMKKILEEQYKVNIERNNLINSINVVLKKLYIQYGFFIDKIEENGNIIFKTNIENNSINILQKQYDYLVEVINNKQPLLLEKEFYLIQDNLKLIEKIFKKYNTLNGYE